MKPKHPSGSSSLKGSFGAREQNPREGGAEVEGESLRVHSLSHRWDAWGRMLWGGGGGGCLWSLSHRFNLGSA